MKQYMKKFVYIIIVLLCLSGSVYAQSFLHVQGQDIVNENGQKVYFQGVGLGNWLLPEGYMWKFGGYGDRPRTIERLVADHLGKEQADRFFKTYRQNYITEADIKRISELGFNSVRPALNARRFLTEGDDNQFVDEGFQLLDNLIKWCKKYHLYVIIDMHAAPGGQTGANIDDSQNDKCELFSDPKNEELLVKLWVKIAGRYKDEPTVAAYDLLNEPIPECTGADKLYKDSLIPVYERLIKAIRAVDKKHMFTLEGYNWAGNWSVFTRPLDPNLFFQFHYYCWSRPDNLSDINYYLHKRDQLNAPVWVGETGEKNNAIYFATTQLFEQNNIGWSFWPWKKMDTRNTPYSIKPPEGWDKVIAYSEAGKDVAKDPEKIFNQFLENIKIENCDFFPDVVNSMLRRLPLKIEAENYGQEGYMKSYFVKDTLTKSSFYRIMEPVKIVLIKNDSTSLASEQAITLSDHEWTSYRVKSVENKKYNMAVKVKAVGKPASVTLFVNGKPAGIRISNTEWMELNLKPQRFLQGENKIKIYVKNGNIEFDWINVYK
ncbi:MAG: cellulase family glycosylhydrolase [Bacteroidota bacterium]|nr:cellulase family glycosylhydrolase [Bacteroidota bacterium]